MEHANIEAVGLGDQLRRFLPVVDEVHFAPLPVIFTSLTIHRVGHELVKVLLHVVLRRSRMEVFSEMYGSIDLTCSNLMSRWIFLKPMS